MGRNFENWVWARIDWIVKRTASERFKHVYFRARARQIIEQMNYDERRARIGGQTGRTAP